MTTQAADTAVQASIVVDAPIERAFSVFTEEMGTWWNAGLQGYSRAVGTA